MVAFEVSTIIAAEQEKVWRTLSDVMSWTHWNPAVDQIAPLDGRLIKLGNRFRVYQPKLRPAIWVVTLVDPPSAFVWTAKSTGMTMIASHIATKLAPFKTTLTLRFIFTGWFGVFVGRIVGRLVRRYLQQEATALRRKAER
jgi:hypothetical protein